MHTLLYLSALLGAALAVPTTKPATCTAYTDTYDDLKASIVSPLSPITEYHGLLYSHWFVKQLGLSPDFIAKSPPNVIVASAQSDILSSVISVTPFGTISVASGTTSFDLTGFYFACTVDTVQAFVGDANSCVVSVFGYNTAGQQQPVQSFSFIDNNPTGPDSDIMQYALLPSAYYTGLVNVTIGLASFGTNIAAGAINVDSLVHCNHK